ncbi:hypothetical protein MNEG_10528 [Monoraphidium neglectum]|uniref:Uncharacterized protein n=1 Tax=Monoraphidium neglectum TaxID=145388 RepID=A0A0D2MSA6_9CHLO|nr:hypothetical protein MNEG_10528 [Monoraphidium neglectum]KIY97435.1 hypothetical protein MNEG_10528 [Monoraphidium neglectum]|eukprot:XP_013896455.1 hypothetical protein MNEG_10528 [Monoraphidium neglectum]
MQPLDGAFAGPARPGSAGGLRPALLPELGGAGGGAFASPHGHLALRGLPDTLFPGFRSCASDDGAGAGGGGVYSGAGYGGSAGGGGGGAPHLNLPDEPFGPHQPPASGGMEDAAAAAAIMRRHSSGGGEWGTGAPVQAPQLPAPPPALFGPPGGLWGLGAGASPHHHRGLQLAPGGLHGSLGGAQDGAGGAGGGLGRPGVGDVIGDEDALASSHSIVTAADAELNKLAQDIMRGLVE